MIMEFFESCKDIYLAKCFWEFRDYVTHSNQYSRIFLFTSDKMEIKINDIKSDIRYLQNSFLLTLLSLILTVSIIKVNGGNNKL